jgi:hypothetical protein
MNNPPSTPAPVGLRGRALDLALGANERERPPPSEGDRRAEREHAMVLIERRALEDRGDDVASEAPWSLRGGPLEASLEAARSGSPLSVTRLRS